MEALGERFDSLALALGRLVLAASVLEKAMLADLLSRKVIRDGAEAVFGQRLVTKLERKPAGALLPYLRDLGYAEDLANSIAVVVAGRNHFIHHLFDDAGFVAAIASGDFADPLERVERLTEDIYRVVKELEPQVTSGVEEVFGKDATQIHDTLRGIDPALIEDTDERSLLEAIQRLPSDLLSGEDDRLP
jgi:hypothetical protein